MVDKFGSTYQPGTVIFRAGDSGDEMFIIHEGEVQISIKAKKSEQVLARLKGGDFFGEMAIFTEKARSATAQVIEKSIILKIKRSSIEYILENNPTFAYNLIKKLCDRIYNTNGQIEELLVLSKETRVLKAIVAYWRDAGTKDASGDELLIKLSPFLDHCASNIGISHNEGKRILNGLRDEGLLKFRRSKSDNIYLSFSPKVFDYFDFT